MREWVTALLELLRKGEAAMLVHLAEARGSSPREAGAQMLVTDTASFGTIGGGELEHQALGRAHQLLTSARAAYGDVKLGPDLGQCCGGSVTLAYEPFAPADLAWVERLAAAAADPSPLIRTVRIDPAGALRRDWERADAVAAEFTVDCAPAGLLIREWINIARHQLWIFGAGHVGRAVVSALHPLGFAITWIDGRAGQFPENAPPQVRCLELAMPELIVDEAPPGALFLVMTHSHALDEAICEAVLRRGDFAYLGLIGSTTKRARFRRRLADAGIAAATLDRLTCPIGIQAIRSKEPAAIAASVAADLLIRQERQGQDNGARRANAV